MKRKKSTQLLAVALTAAMLAQPVGAQMVFAEGNADAVQQEQAVSPAAETTGAVLKSGTAVIPADADLSQVKEILGKTLVENADQVDLNSLEWEYECKATSGLSSNTAWGSIEGFTSSKKGIFGTTTYTHPSLAANTDGTYKVRLKGTTTEVTLTKTQKLTSAISIKDNTNVNLVYNEDGSINYDAVRQNIFNTVVESTTPELTVNDVTIEYYATATTGAAVGFGKEWMPLEGGESGTLIPLTYPAMGDGTQKIKISYAGTDAYSGASAEATVNIGIGKEQSVIAFKENPTIKLVYNDDLTVDYAAAKEAIMNDVIDVENSSPEGLSLDNLTIEYYATGALGSLVKAWAPIEGGKVNGLTYPGIPEGEAVPGQMACRAGKSSFVVNWQGEMRSCVVLDKPSIPLRNVEFEEAWKFTKKETESLRISARCSSCKLRKVCNTCVAAAIAETGKADGVPEYLCRYTEATVRYLKETSKK